ncbi:alpha/beta hydrolase fold domain protein [Mycobacterium xenopi 4042]|uniref:Alpha/beta hydrolase fold domain protein n=1 Tax=Mycobacterium xenopi 4042 TaxID=1299334 RepID=X8DF18_MYCXE|nr:alpha/beta hydrolase fold domain protein [Mycobacterium xenopi 4042]
MDDVTHRLSDRYRCIAPTWPFGAQRNRSAERRPGCRGGGRRILGLLEALDLSDVTLVANDTRRNRASRAGDDSLDFARVPG